MNGLSDDQPPSDEELARTVAAGANLPSSSESVRAAFAQLHDRYGRLILAFTSSRTRDASVAQDLSQDVWCRAWRMLPTSFKGGHFRAWLYEIARNRIIDESRKRQTQQLPDEFDPAQRLDDDGEINQHHLTAFRDCFGGLDDERRKVVQLRLAGLSHDHIGAELGINSNTAMTRFHRAKKDLADCMQSKLQ